MTPRSDRASKRSRLPGRSRASAVAVLALLLAACAGSGPQSALEPEGPIARHIDGLWNMVLGVAVVVFVLVNAALLFSILRFRERKSDTRRPRQIHGNTRLEIVWTIIPAVLLAVLAVPTVQGIFEVRVAPAGDDIVHVSVTGHQWWWEFEYPDILSGDGSALTTANELHIPAGVPVELTMTSADVIHSFWVPPLNGKRDVVPGRTSRLTLEADPAAADVDRGYGQGVILGQCAEFCGLAHADMRLRVFVHAPERFAAWAAEQLEPAPVAAEGAAADGYATFAAVCVACHQATVEQPDGTVEKVGDDRFIDVDGTTFRAQFGPNLTHFGSRTTFGGATFDNTTEHLAEWIDDPSTLKPMSPERNDLATGRVLGMPSYGLNDEEIDQVVTMLEGWR